MNKINTVKHPGQAVKIITDDSGEHTIVKAGGAEVCKKCCEEKALMSTKDTKQSCDNNVIKFIFKKHGIEVISDVETIV